ncbi:MAG: SDR family oxidoreductase [Desulfobacterales bacterium]|nr:SDR family oxidoreductase [Desulfobacterales bacterium]
MKILILGATGRTGNLVCREALSRNYEVKAIVRNKDKIGISGIECYEGVPTDETLIKKAIKNVDAAVCCLNISRKSEFPWAKLIAPETLISDSIKALIKVMEEENIKRIVTISAWGAEESLPQLKWIFRLLIKYSNIQLGFNDHNRQEKILKQSGLDWTIVRPVFLNNNDSSNYQVTDKNPVKIGVSRKAVAKFIVDVLDKNLFIKENPIIYQ